MSSPLAYLITWTTYGTWLSGDERGWVKDDLPGIQNPDERIQSHARAQMDSPPITLSHQQRSIVEATVRGHCQFRRWQLHAVNARSNHVHIVVSADAAPELVMNQFKSWCSRRLNERPGATRSRWWTKHGSTKWINDEAYLLNAIRYVKELQ
jgi:REP element-mobilizing transposase RayT